MKKGVVLEEAALDRDGIARGVRSGEEVDESGVTVSFWAKVRKSRRTFERLRQSGRGPKPSRLPT